MNASTMKKTAMCEYCKTPITYKTIEKKNTVSRHIHALCLKAEKGQYRDPFLIKKERGK